MEALVKRILDGDRRSAAKAITIIENNEYPKKDELIRLLFRHTGRARIIGITGPPGAGKSTLVDGLIEEIRNNNLTVGIIAIDPSSPYTGGAILGDRVRMQRHSLDKGVFIRSMGTRGMLGGLSRATKEAIYVLDALGLDVILIETVGVGQSELEIVNIADTTVVVLHPSTGDSIQAAKAGIMEVADIFVVNKSDLKGSQKMVYELEELLDTAKKGSLWKIPVLKTVSSERLGIDDLWMMMKKHYQFLKDSGLFLHKQKENIDKYIVEHLQYQFQNYLYDLLGTDDFTEMRELILKREKSPIDVAKKIFPNLYR